MKIFDSLKNKKWSGRGFDVKAESILVLKSANFSQPISIKPGKYKFKIVGKKRTGSGKIIVEISSDDNEILLKKEINFNNNSWSEFTFEFETKNNLGDGKIKFIRERNIYGSVEIGRVFIDLNMDVDTNNINPKMIGKRKKIIYNIDDEKFIAKPTSKKLAFVIPYHIYGGAEVYIQNIINQLDHVYQINILYLQENKLQSYLNGSHIQHRLVKNLSQLEGILKSNQYDYVIYYNRLDVYALLREMKSKKDLNSKLVEIYHSDFIWAGSLSSIKNREYVDKMIVVASSLALDIKGIASENRDVIPVGIDINKFSPRKNYNLKKSIGAEDYKGIIGTVARLSKEKQIDYILSLADTMRDFYFVIVGDGPEEKSLKGKALELNLDNIQFAGFQKNTEEYYNIFDAFVLVSRMEGTPISIIEAMASGVPVFSNMVGAIPDLITDKVTGFKITGNPSEDALLIESNIANKRVIKSARSYIEENHDFKKNSERFIRSLFNLKHSVVEKKEEHIMLLPGEYV